MAASEAQRLADLRAARDAGVLMVRHGDTSTTFRSLAEMEQIIADLERRTGVTTGHKRLRYIMQPRKGL
jgi:hypothetical protein